MCRWLSGVRGPRHRGRRTRQEHGQRAAGGHVGVISRTLSDRLAAVRTKAQASPWSPSAADDRTALLARWFAARTQVVEGGGTALVVERSVAVTARAAQALAPLPAAAYFDTETTGLSTGAGTAIFLAGVARINGARVTARQYLLPDYPHEPARLRPPVAAPETAARP